MTLPIIRCAWFLAAAILAPAAELQQITWPTGHASAPPVWDAKLAPWVPAFQLAIATLPEASIIDLALNQPALLGLTPDLATKMRPLMSQRYQQIAKSDLYAKAPSALPYCFAADAPTRGQASVYVPSGATSETPVIVFLHGHGGSFLWYQHALSTAFPDHLIICPAFGINTATIPQSYVAESMATTSKHLGFPLAKPTLIGLSAGGFGACRIYARDSVRYAQMICLAAYPTDDTLARFTAAHRPRFLAGSAEYFVTSGDFQRRADRVHRTCPHTEHALIDGADHFFLLTHPEPTINQLRKWLLVTSKPAQAR